MAADAWPVDDSVEEKWSALRTLMADTWEEVLGKMRRYPHWLQKSVSKLKPALWHRNRMYTLWLSTGKKEDC